MRRYAGKILLALRDGLASDWPSLCDAMDVRPRLDSQSLPVLRELRDLHEVGVVKLEQPGAGDYSPPAGVISLSPAWTALQAALGLSLSTLARLHEDDVVVATPLFGHPPSVRATDVFVIMPFSSELEPVYRDHIRPVVQKLGRTVGRADDLFTSHAVMSDIWGSLLHCKVVVADCTGRNPNVFYELGIAHTLGVPVVLVTQSEADVPADIRHMRYIPYHYTPPGMRAFETALTKTLTGIFRRPP
jgi:hypothetical protein